MVVTKQQFELDLKTFTLGNMFAMQLQSHATAIAGITNGALKELTIENDLKKMADVWKEQRFELHKYNHVSGRTVRHGTVVDGACFNHGVVLALLYAAGKSQYAMLGTLHIQAHLMPHTLYSCNWWLPCCVYRVVLTEATC
jgi:hypothetical protein